MSHDRRSFIRDSLPSLALGVPLAAAGVRSGRPETLDPSSCSVPDIADPGDPLRRSHEVQELIDQARKKGEDYAIVPHSLLPYDADAVTFHPSVQMLRASNISAVFDVRAYGASGDGTTDDTAACQKAIDHAARGNGAVRVPGGTYHVTSLDIPRSVNVIGEGPATTTIEGVGQRGTITGTGRLRDQTFAGFTVQHTGSTGSGVDLIDLQQGALWCTFQHIVFSGHPGVTRAGFHLRGENPDTGEPNTNQFNNLLLMCRSRSQGKQIDDGIAVWLDGVDAFNKRCNLNKVIGGSWDGFGTAISLESGNANYFFDLNINSAERAAFSIRGDRETFNNFITGCFVDSRVTGAPLRVESTDDSPHTLVQVFGSNRIEVPADVRQATPNAKYSIFSRSLFIGNSMSQSLAHERAQVVAGTDPKGLIRTMGGPEFSSGGFIASGSDFRRDLRAVSDGGGASAVVRETGGDRTSFRVVSTPDGEKFGIRFQVSEDGRVEVTNVVDFRGNMRDSGKDPREDEPDDWIEVEIEGEAYFVPAYER